MNEARAQEEINKYRKFRKVDGATYRKVNQFLRKRTYITAREWALARLCTDFRTSGGAEMTFIGAHLPELVPFMEDTYSPQAVNQARNSFKKKVRKSSATFFYGAMCGFFTTEELDDLLFEASEVARFLLEVESTTLDIDEEIDIEDRITGVMRSVGEAAKTVLKTRGIENGGADAAASASTAAPSELPASPGSPPKASRRGRKRKAHLAETPQDLQYPVTPAPVPVMEPREDVSAGQPVPALSLAGEATPDERTGEPETGQPQHQPLGQEQAGDGAPPSPPSTGYVGAENGAAPQPKEQERGDPGTMPPDTPGKGDASR